MSANNNKPAQLSLETQSRNSQDAGPSTSTENTSPEWHIRPDFEEEMIAERLASMNTPRSPMVDDDETLVGEDETMEDEDEIMEDENQTMEDENQSLKRKGSEKEKEGKKARKESGG